MKRMIWVILLVWMAGCSKDPIAERDKYFASAQEYLEAGRYDEATIEFRNALRADKTYIPSYLGIAEAFKQMGNYRDAIASYQEVIRLDSKNIEARLGLGEYLRSAGITEPRAFEKMQSLAEEILAIDESNVKAIILLGNAYAGQKKVDESIAQYEKALELEPTNRKALLNLAAAQLAKNNVPEAEGTLQKALGLYPDSMETHLAAAVFYSATKRSSETEMHLKKAFDLAPDNPTSMNALASYYLGLGKTAEAEGVFREAIKRRPESREPLWGLSVFYLSRKQTDDAVNTLLELLKRHKEDQPALLGLAEIYVLQNDHETAKKYINDALALNPNDPKAHYFLGRIYRKNSEFDKAKEEFDTAIQYDPNDPTLAPAYLEKANLEVMRGELDACESTLKEVLRRNKDYLPAWGAYAKLLAIRQNPEDALLEANKVLDVMPNNEDAIGARANALKHMGRFDESAKDWALLCEMQPDNSSYRYQLGSVEAAQGKNAEAKKNLLEALRLNPNQSSAINDLIYLYVKAKDFDAALSELDSLSEFSIRQDEIHRLRGSVYIAAGNISAGEKEIRKSIEINPENYQSYVLLAQLKGKQGDYSQAIKEVDSLIEQNDKLPSAFLMKALYQQLSDDIPSARNSYRKVLEMDPENAIASNNLAWILAESEKNLEEAVQLAKTAKKKLPDDAEISETLGWAYYKMKNYTLAIDQLLFSINKRSNPEAMHYYRLGLAYFGKGDKLHARQAMRKALDLSPSFPAAGEARRILEQTQG